MFLLDPNDSGPMSAVLTPTVNMLTIMDVSNERFMLPHCVSEVAAGVDAIRTALTGWFQLGRGAVCSHAQLARVKGGGD
jgi:hypothetical protein